VLVVLATAMQMVTPGSVAKLLGGAAPGSMAYGAMQCAEILQSTRKRHPLGMTLAHGVVTKACADVFAQCIPQSDAALAMIDPLRVLRSMFASLLSTSLPFYHWTKLMAKLFPAGGGSPVLSALGVDRMLSGKFSLSMVKTVVTQALFRPLNVGSFLFFQSLFRGDSARALMSVIKKKIKSSIVGGVIFYTLSNFLMYMFAPPFLQPIFGSVAGLMFNVWLAYIAYKK